MQKMLKQGFPHDFQQAFHPDSLSEFWTNENPRSVSDLLSRTGNKVNALKKRAAAAHKSPITCARRCPRASPEPFREPDPGWPVDHRRDRRGVGLAAALLHTDTLRAHVGAAAGTDIRSVRVRADPTLETRSVSGSRNPPRRPARRARDTGAAVDLPFDLAAHASLPRHLSRCGHLLLQGLASSEPALRHDVFLDLGSQTASARLRPYSR